VHPGWESHVFLASLFLHTFVMHACLPQHPSPSETKMSAKQEVSIVVMGGSVTFGCGCHDPFGQHLQSCAWPRALQRALVANFGAPVRLFDLAAPSTDSQIIPFAARKLSVAPDMMIIDYFVNDAYLPDFENLASSFSTAVEPLVTATAMH
jgi:hypothetical protein